MYSSGKTMIYILCARDNLYFLLLNRDILHFLHFNRHVPHLLHFNRDVLHLSLDILHFFLHVNRDILHLLHLLHLKGQPPDPINHVQICKGQTRRFVLWELVRNWYKTFPPDHFGRV